MEYKDYYKILGVARDAGLDEIKRTYRKLARKYHPDVSKEPDAETRFKEIGEAYEVLKDSEKRAAYDQLGSQWRAGQEFRPPPDWSSQFHFDGKLDDIPDLGNLFESLFGGGLGAAASAATGRAGRRGSGSARRAGGHAMAGEDQHVKLAISLEESFNGADRVIRLQVPEVTTDGRVSTRNRSLSVKIPKGTKEGQSIRLAGQGGPGMGGMKGDLYLDVVFQAHPLYRVEERDIYLDLPITPWEAALGATVTVPTLGGKVELKIPSDAQTGNKLRLKGRGLPGKPSGDQYIVLQLVTPRADTPAARKFYQQMARELPMNPRAALGV